MENSEWMNIKCPLLKPDKISFRDLYLCPYDLLGYATFILNQRTLEKG